MTATNANVSMPMKKMVIAKDAITYAIIATIVLAVLCGGMAGAEYVGLPAWTGLSLTIVSNFYVGWRKMSTKNAVIGTTFMSALVAFLFYAPFGDLATAVFAICFMTTITGLATAKRVQETPWWYYDFSKMDFGGSR